MHESITNYMILSRKSTSELSKVVEMSIRNGFQPHGSIAVEQIRIHKLDKAIKADHTLYYQPMVKICEIN